MGFPAQKKMNQLNTLKYVEVQDVYVLLSIMHPPKKIVITDSSRFWNIDVLVALGRTGIQEIEIEIINITPAKMASYTQRTKRNCLNVRLKERDIS